MFIRHPRIAICLPIRHKLIQIRFRMTLMTLLDSTKTCSECTAIAKTYFRFFLFHFVRQEYACMNVSIFRPKLPCCLPHLKYGSEEKGSSICKCSILLSFFMSKKLERLRSELLSEDKITNLLGFLT